MSLEPLFRQILDFTGSVNPALFLAGLFLITCIGEFGISVPYLLETIWLLTGYHLADGTLPVPQFLVIWMMSEAGRQAGAAALYQVSRLGSTPLTRLYNRLFGAAQSRKPSSWQNLMPFCLVRRIDCLSPFSVGLGRLVWLRIPLTLTLALKRKWLTLAIGILLSSAAWDGAYILIGFISKNVVPRPAQMILYSLGGLTLLYALTFLVRQLRRRAKSIPTSA